jgi:hypothetical protein
MKNLKIPVLNYLLVILVSTSIISCSEDGADGINGLTNGANNFRSQIWNYVWKQIKFETFSNIL